MIQHAVAAAVVALVVLSAGTTHAQDGVPPACREDAQGQVNYRACAEAAPPGTPFRSLSLINLATDAFLAHDYAQAVKLYDDAIPPRQKIYSDPYFHAFRGVAYDRVGREAEGLVDAQTALGMLEGKRFPGAPQTEVDPAVVLSNILPILKKARDPGFERALVRYRALPVRDWVDDANRATVLLELGDIPGALAAHEQALKTAPKGNPGVLNLSCYLLTSAGRPAEGLPHCEQAVAIAPNEAAIHDSYATALARLGRCNQAQAELANARRLDPVTVEYQRKMVCAGG